MAAAVKGRFSRPADAQRIVTADACARLFVSVFPNLVRFSLPDEQLM